MIIDRIGSGKDLLAQGMDIEQFIGLYRTAQVNRHIRQMLKLGKIGVNDQIGLFIPDKPHRTFGRVLDQQND